MCAFTGGRKRESESEAAPTKIERERERDVPREGGLPIAPRLIDREEESRSRDGVTTDKGFWLRRRGRAGLLGGWT